jgi:hypothetical protein
MDAFPFLKLRDEFLNGEIFYSMKEIRVLAERWRIHFNTIRPHSSPGYRPPAPESWQSELKTGYAEVESKVRFPLSHITDYCDGSYLLPVIGLVIPVPVAMLVFDQI